MDSLADFVPCIILMVKVDVVDPFASPEEIKEEYCFELSDSIQGPYNGIVVAVNHEEYTRLDEAYFQSISVPGAVFADLKGVFRNRVNTMDYWSL